MSESKNVKAVRECFYTMLEMFIDILTPEPEAVFDYSVKILEVLEEPINNMALVFLQHQDGETVDVLIPPEKLREFKQYLIAGNKVQINGEWIIVNSKTGKSSLIIDSITPITNGH